VLDLEKVRELGMDIFDLLDGKDKPADTPEF